MSRAAWCGVLLCAASCGGATAEHGTSGADRSGPPVELTLRSPEGQWLDLADLRGAPTVLFFFATFDGNSQAAVLPFSRVFRGHPEAHFVGIAIQPDARELLAAYRDALHLQFAVGYDPDGTILGGGTALGDVDTVPTFIVLDAEGRISDRYAGVASERRLEAMIVAAGVPLRSPPAGSR